MGRQTWALLSTELAVNDAYRIAVRLHKDPETAFCFPISTGIAHDVAETANDYYLSQLSRDHNHLLRMQRSGTSIERSALAERRIPEQFVLLDY